MSVVFPSYSGAEGSNVFLELTILTFLKTRIVQQVLQVHLLFLILLHSS